MVTFLAVPFSSISAPLLKVTPGERQVGDLPHGYDYACSAFLANSKQRATSVTVSAVAWTLYSYSMFAGMSYFSFLRSCSTAAMGVSPWPHGQLLSRI